MLLAWLPGTVLWVAQVWWMYLLLPAVTFDLYHTPPLASLQIQVHQLMRLRTQLEEKSVILCGGGVAPPKQEVGCVIGINGIVCVLVMPRLWLVALFVDFLWASSGQSTFDIEWTSLRNRMVLLCLCLAHSFQHSFRSIDYIKCTLLSLATTPLQRTWLNGHVWISCTSWMSFMWFTCSFCAPPPNSLA